MTVNVLNQFNLKEESSVNQSRPVVTEHCQQEKEHFETIDQMANQ